MTLSQPTPAHDEIPIDCRGLQCPAPILKLANIARQHKGQPRVLHIQATDQDFLTDLEAWCRTTRSSVLRSYEQEGVVHALVGIHGATLPAPPASTPSQNTADALDLRGLSASAAIKKLSAAASTGRLRVLSDAPDFKSRLYAWATATGATIERMLSNNQQITADILLDEEDAPPASFSAPPPVTTPTPSTPAAFTPPAPTPTPPPALAPVAAPPTAALVPVASTPGVEVVVKENRATLLVLHNDYEKLLSAMMIANASASQGMEVEIYFAFWGINLLRGETRRKLTGPAEKKPALMQRMMAWMMPRGPRRQKMSKMHMGGVGKFMLEFFMRRSNVMTIEELMQQAGQQDVKFIVCSMSMGIMGIQRADIMDLPNISFGGVTSFAESSRRASFSLVF